MNRSGVCNFLPKLVRYIFLRTLQGERSDTFKVIPCDIYNICNIDYTAIFAQTLQLLANIRHHKLLAIPDQLWL